MRDIASFRQPVVPTLMTLALLVQSQELGGRKVKFGTRVQQAKSLCTDRANCQFGYTFDGQLRETSGPGSEGGDFREIVFIPPTSSPDTGSQGQNNLGARPEAQFNSQNAPPTPKVTPNRRRLRLNIDPRRKSQDRRVDPTTDLKKARNPGLRARGGNIPKPQRKAVAPERKIESKPTAEPQKPQKPEQPRSFELFQPAFPEDENTVTINIGGTPIVIPDFDLSPPPADNQPTISGTKNRNSPKPPKPTRKPVQNQRRNRNQQKVKNQRRQGQRNKQASKQTTIPPTTRQRTTQRTPPPNTFATTLTSFNSLLDERESFRSFNNFTPAPQAIIQKPTKGKPSPRGNFQSARKQVPTTTQRTTKITPRRRNQPKKSKNNAKNRNKTPRRPTPKPRNQNSSIKGELKSCPGTLENCVDTCVPLEDIYAYSACVVECGERC